jgi:hypothetical protein
MLPSVGGDADLAQPVEPRTLECLGSPPPPTNLAARVAMRTPLAWSPGQVQVASVRQFGEGLSKSSLALHRTIPPWPVGFADSSHGQASRIVRSGALA